ncbi:phosphoglycolate phosphatase [Paracoccus sp. Z118]|uniref:phosphoglycolate phosphatase n=1 Tax=Paracoccus sp. Z118 TaxID=2851017 RepID=UPI001C2C7DAE|nr:phosphoglycolate phosphatase [Paracoccus sp. Z118]MBV0892570.1 phosphoglycolate phosphatase [Paracoccus sp. Z118]
MTAVIFDLDGTLVDSAPDMHAALNRVLAERGRPALTLGQVRGFVGHGVPTLVRRAMVAVGAAEDSFDDWHDGYMRCYGEGICERTTPYPGVVETLELFAARGHRLGVCTNKPQGLTEALLDRLNLTPRFAAVLGGDTPFGRKPDPGVLREVVARLGGGPAVMIGDSAADIGAARGAGHPVLLFLGGYADAALDAGAADAAFNDWAMVPGLVEAALSSGTVSGRQVV